MVLLHGTWIAAMLLEGSGDGARRHRGWALVALAVQPLRYWVIASLGDRWTTRVLVPPGEPPIARGPYRRLRHPNYAVVAVEIASLPLAVGARTTAAAFTIANAALMAVRIPTEDRALRSTMPGDRRMSWEPA
jgi:methyltransferase